METKDGVNIKNGMPIFRETPEGRIEGRAFIEENDPPPYEGMLHVKFFVSDLKSNSEEVSEGWWPLDQCYSVDNK